MVSSNGMLGSEMSPGSRLMNGVEWELGCKLLLLMYDLDPWLECGYPPPNEELDTFRCRRGSMISISSLRRIS